jgi:hypothetical protein
MITDWKAPLLTMLVVTLDVLSPARSNAQPRVQVQPLFSIAEVHDSNLFSTSRGRQADFITRATPGLATTYESPLLMLTGRYSVDLERFVSHPELTSMNARQQGTVSLRYRFTPRMSLTASADWLATRTPWELNTLTGLTATRAAARRQAANATVRRQFSSVTSGSVTYTATRDRLDRAFTSISHAAAATVERRLSPRTGVRGTYRVETFFFTVAQGHENTGSNAVGVGASHALNRTIRLSLDAGPRLIGGNVRPDVAASVACDGAVNLSLAYSRSYTTVLGVPAPVAVERLGMTIDRLVERSFEIQVSPALFRSTLAGAQARVFALDVNVRRPISPRVGLEFTLHGNAQHGSLLPSGAGRLLPRHSILLRLVMAGPDAARTAQ